MGFLFTRPDQVDGPLYVVTCIFNPARYRRRWWLYPDFAKHVAEAGAVLYTAEIAYGDRAFAVTSPDNPHHLQLRSDDELWHKERALNLAIARLPADWQAVAWIDADVMFARPDWANETLQQLQHYDVVQMWREAVDLDDRHNTVLRHRSFVSCYLEGCEEPMPPDYSGYGRKGSTVYWHPGFAWAARRSALDRVGMLYDTAPLGSADDHMAKALLGRASATLHPALTQGYRDAVARWEARAVRELRTNVGFVDGMLLHEWHGPKAARQYKSRWRILTDNAFDPATDLKADWQGLWQWDDMGAPRMQRLRDDVRHYFRTRDEDMPRSR